MMNLDLAALVALPFLVFFGTWLGLHVASRMHRLREMNAALLEDNASLRSRWQEHEQNDRRRSAAQAAEVTER